MGWIVGLGKWGGNDFISTRQSTTGKKQISVFMIAKCNYAFSKE